MLAVCVALVLIGGVKRIASVSQVVVPFMAVLYVLFVGVLVITNITKVPAAFKIIVEAAFSPKAVTGGLVGSMLVAMQKGVARGIFSNEAGLGSAPIAAAAAQTKEPVRQGLVSMTGTFIDTIVICTLTGLSIVITGAWQVEGLQGVQVTTYAFQNGLPFPAQVSSFVLMLCLVFFAFTTILGWDYYSERCLEYLTNGKKKCIKAYRWIYILCVFIGPYMTVSAVLKERADAALSRYHKLGDSIKAAEKRMAEIAVLRAHIVNYAKTRPVYDAYRKSGYSSKFLEAHREEITLHKAAKAAFNESGLKKLPKVKDLNAEYSALLTKKKALYPEYRKARDEMQDIVKAQKNVELFFVKELVPSVKIFTFLAIQLV